MISFRPFDYTEQEYEACAVLHDAVWTEDPTDIENWKHWDSIRPKDQYRQRIVAEIDGERVGYGGFSEARYLAEPHTYGISWLTHPDHQRKGVATAFYEHALQKINNDGHTINKVFISTREDKPQSVSWLQNRGYEQKNRYPRSELKLAEFDAAPFAGYPDRIATHGLVIKPLSEVIPNDPNWQRKLYDLEWVFEQDEPTPDEPKQEPFEQYVKGTLENPEFTPATWFMALDGDRFAGMSCLWPDKQKPHLIHTGWTGVDRPYRKKGLAMAMKLTAIEYAKAHPDITTIRTDNHETNWMFQINLRLGFTPIPAYLSFQQVFV